MKRILFIFTLMGSVHLSAKFDATPFILSAWESTPVKLQMQNKLEFGEDGISNPIDSMQVKLEQEEKPEKREGALRIVPRGWTEYRTLSRLRTQQSRLEIMDLQDALSKALLERYLTLVDYAMIARKREALMSLRSAADKVFMMTRAASKASSAEARDVVRARADFESTHLELEKVNGEMDLLVLKMKSLDPKLDISQLGPIDLPTADDLDAVIKKLSDSEKQENDLAVSLAKEKAELARNEFSYDKAKNERLLDYLEVKAEQDRDQRNYSLAIAINIPGFAAGDHGTREKARKLVSYEIEANEVERLKPLAQQSAKLSLQRSLVLYKSVSSAFDVKTNERIQRLAKTQDPMLAVNMEKDNLNRVLRNISITQETLHAYFSYLAEFNFLAFQPRTHYLTKNLKEI